MSDARPQGVEVCVDVPVRRRFHDEPHLRRVGQDLLPLQQHRVAERGVGHVNLRAGLEGALALLIHGVRPVNQVGQLEQLQVVRHLGPGHAELLGHGVQGQHRPRVQAEIDEQPLQVEDVSHAVAGAHVPFENAVHDVFPQESLRQSQIVRQGRLGKPAGQEVAGQQRPERQGSSGGSSPRMRRYS